MRLFLPRQLAGSTTGLISLVAVLALSSLFCMAGSALAAEWNPERPEYYRVVEGDTLWSIAGRFLNRPWDWPEVWRGNAQIQNPNLIYPGDVIVLESRGGTGSYLRLEAGSTYRLSPRIRVTPLDAAIPIVPLKVISPFLTRPQVVELEDLESLPYVVDLAEEHVLGSPGDRLYVRSIMQTAPVDYTVFRPGAVYRDPDTDQALGHEAIFIAEAHLEQTGDPATLALIRAEKEVRAGDRLLPTRRIELGAGYFPHPPRKNLSGHIIGVMDGVSQIGQFSVVALDRGQADGVEVGHVFEVWQKGPLIRDTVGLRFGEKLAGPEQEAGLLMVFLTFRRVSYGLVMKAERFIHILDVIRAPGMP